MGRFDPAARERSANGSAADRAKNERRESEFDIAACYDQREMR
jgi:hypothetical protein